jgi:large subunit ribosomal protein L30
MARTFVWHRTRGPKSTPRDEAPGSGRLRIKQVRSAIGHPERMRLTLAAIGLRHHQATVVKQDSAALRGQIRKVRHLVEVTPVSE